MNVSTCSDYYQQWDFATAMAAVYITLSLTSLIVNVYVLVIGFTMLRIRKSPKYWLVFAISVVFICQSALVNNIVSARWLLNAEITHTVWKICILCNRYLVMGFVSWASLLINLDFLLCIKSVTYTRQHRSKVVVILVTLIWTSMATAVFTICFMRDSRSSEYVVLPNWYSHQILLSVTIFTPQVLNILSCVLALILRYSSTLHKVMALNEDVSNPTDPGDCPYLPPSDHITFGLLLLIFYIPNAIVTFEPIWVDECSEVLTFLTVSTVLRDNAGCVAPLVWLLFKDIRRSCRKCLGKRRAVSTSSLLDSSEMDIYNNYPYCQRIQA